MYKVLKNLRVKVKGEIKVILAGSIVRLPEQAANMFIQQNKLKRVFEPVDDLNERMAIMGENTCPDKTKPYVTDSNDLVIPYNSNSRYHYWNGGQSPCDTLRELRRCDLIGKYQRVFNN